MCVRGVRVHGGARGRAHVQRGRAAAGAAEGRRPRARVVVVPGPRAARGIRAQEPARGELTVSLSSEKKPRKRINRRIA